MSDGLFSALELDGPSAARVGWRLHRIEVLNWGTFDGRVWALHLDGENTLLTGDIGSGKSTLVDAVTTLLLPAHRISYNKAAGAESRERSLRSYVEGHYKSERIESTGTSRPVGLRDHRSYSVILGVFANDDAPEPVTLAQVFTQRDRAGQPDRFFVTAERDLAVERDFAGFGTDLNALRRRLREAGASVDKDHMLEPSDPTERIAQVVAHVEDLTRAHDAVRRAQDQLAALDPLLITCDKHDALAEERAATGRRRDAVALFFTEHKIGLLEQRQTSLGKTLDALATERVGITSRLEQARTRQARLIGERAAAGGDRVADLEQTVKELRELAEQRRARSEKYARLLEDAGLDQVVDGQSFHERSVEARAAYDEAAPQLRALDAGLAEAMGRRAGVREQVADVRADLDSLAGRPTNLPRESLRLRERLCAELGLAEDEVPFVGELLEVAEEHSSWRGAAERVLRGFGLSLLVPQRHYRQVADWVDSHHLGARLVYHRVPERQVRVQPDADGMHLRLVDTLLLEPGPFETFLAGELRRRADHRCVDSVAELAEAERAVTRQGQVRAGARHEKDDRRRVDDPRSWVLGRSNARKIEALTEELHRLQEALTAAEAEVESVEADRDAVRQRAETLSNVAQFGSWTEVDVATPIDQAEAAEAERRRLLAGSSRLAEVDRALSAVEEEIANLDERRTDVDGRLRVAESDRDRSARDLAVAGDLVAAAGEEVVALARAEYPTLAPRAVDVTEPGECDRRAGDVARSLTADMERLQLQMNGLATSAQTQMTAIKAQWPALTTEMDAPSTTPRAASSSSSWSRR